MTETYLESAKGITISRDRAIQEMCDHGITDTPTILEGLCESMVSVRGGRGQGNDYWTGGTYDAEKLLLWLGY